MADAPRNLLFIVVDQFRADLLNGDLANLAPTPNIDRLAAQSVRYMNHHTVTVPCGPSRASLLTGQYAMNHRSVRNGTPLPRRHPTLAGELRKMGREPLLFGYTDTTPDPGGMAANDPAHLSYTGPMPGFTEVLEMRSEAWAWLAHLRSQDYDVPNAESDDFDRLYRPEAGVHGNPALYRAEDSDTAFLTDRTIAALDVRRAQPWSALVTYIRPHPPFVAPAPYHNLIAPEDVPAPRAAGFEHSFFEAYHSGPTENDLFWGFDGYQRNLSAADIAQARATYLGLVAEVDHHIGRLLDWLDDTGQAEETLVVFTADHGEMLGDLGTWGKATVFRQASHVPLLIRQPGVAPAQVSDLTRCVDVAPTLLNLLGADAPGTMDGKILRPGDEREDILMVEMELGTPDGSGRYEAYTGRRTEDCRAVILETDAWRLVHFACGFAPMLFDIRNDPGCTVDLASENPDQVATLRAQLLDFRISHASR